MVVRGAGFVNSTQLRCRIGEFVSVPTFLSDTLLLCFTTRMPEKQPDHAYLREYRTQSLNTPHERAAHTSPGKNPGQVFIEVSNNGQDYTNDRKVRVC